MCATEASYTLKQIGAPIYSGVFNAYCGFREMSPYMWGYIFAAKRIGLVDANAANAIDCLAAVVQSTFIELLLRFYRGRHRTIHIVKYSPA